MSRWSRLSNSLYSGQKSVNVVGRWKLWYSISGVILVVTIASLLIQGLNLGIEFKGGAQFVFPAPGVTVSEARTAASSAGVEGAIVTQIGENKISITTPPMTSEEAAKFASDISTALKVPANSISVQQVGPSWGKDITTHAWQALAVFVALVFLFLFAYFQWRFSVAALVALFHDVIITIGIYSLFHIEVTPATVIGILTILGYSLYDTVVVFDKVRENTKDIEKQSRYTYGEAANLAVNQTFIRSINTSIVALLPVAAILIIGVGVLQAGTLKDLALALFVGIAAGTYSSIFIATPILVQLQSANPKIKALNARVMARRGSGAAAAKVTNDAAVVASGGTLHDDEASTSEGAKASTVVSTGTRQQPRRKPKSQR